MCVRAQVGGVRVILEAMQRLVGSTEVQWKGADMIRTLISEQPQVGWDGLAQMGWSGMGWDGVGLGRVGDGVA